MTGISVHLEATKGPEAASARDANFITIFLDHSTCAVKRAVVGQ